MLPSWESEKLSVHVVEARGTREFRILGRDGVARLGRGGYHFVADSPIKLALPRRERRFMA